ncbi:MAG: restriction endonuclease subunit S [Ignavibacteria bacterium]
MKKQKYIPVLRFPEYKGEWEEKALGEIAEINPPNESLPEEFIYIDLESVENGELKKEYLLLNKDAPSRAQRILKRKDILFQMVRPYQKNNLYFDKNGVYVASTGYAQIRANQSTRYLYQYLHFQYFVNDVIKRCTGTSYPAINSTDLSKIFLLLPNHPEQQKIATFLTNVDDKLTQLKKKKTLLEQYKKGVIQKIFSQEIRFKDENGKEFPMWGEKKLKEITEIYDGTHQTPDYQDKGIPFYSVEHVTSNNFLVSKYISREVFEKENARVKLEKGDILMTRIGDIGTAKYINWDIEASFYVSLALIKSSKNNNSEFICHFINSNYFHAELHKRTIHVAFPKKINLGEIGECLIKHPSLPEQTIIANFLSAIDDKINLVSEQIEKAELWKKGLLQKMFC